MLTDHFTAVIPQAESFSFGDPFDGIAHVRIDGIWRIMTAAELTQAQGLEDQANQEQQAISADRAALKNSVTQAVADNTAYLAIANPSNAQNTAQLKRLTQQMNAVIKARRRIV